MEVGGIFHGSFHHFHGSFYRFHGSVRPASMEVLQLPRTRLASMEGVEAFTEMVEASVTSVEAFTEMVEASVTSVEASLTSMEASTASAETSASMEAGNVGGIYW